MRDWKSHREILSERRCLKERQSAFSPKRPAEPTYHILNDKLAMKVINTPVYRLRRVKSTEVFGHTRKPQSVDDYFAVDVEERISLKLMEEEFEEVKENLILRAKQEAQENREFAHLKRTLRGRKKISFTTAPESEVMLPSLIQTDAIILCKSAVEAQSTTLKILQDKNMGRLVDDSVFWSATDLPTGNRL